MYHSLIKSSLLILAAGTLFACADKSDEIEIAVTDVPTNIINTVQNALPGITLHEAEKEIKNGGVIYELEGKLINGREYEVKITEDGTILKIELED